MASAPARATPGDLAAYMKARAADAAGQGAVAVGDYAAALAAAPDNPLVAIRAYREALAAGDDALADRAAAVLARAGIAPADAALLAVAVAARAHDDVGAATAIEAVAHGRLAVLAPALRGWLAYERGTDPFAPLAAAGQDAVARRFASENRMLLLIATGKVDDGVAALRALTGPDQSSRDLTVAAAQLLAATGHDDFARKLLAGDDPVFSALRDQLGHGVAPSLAFGTSRLFTRVAADLSAGDPTPLSITLTRAALRAEPGNDRARLLLADTLSRTGDTRQALAVLAHVDANGPYAAIARSASVTVLAAADDDAATLAAAAALARRHDATPFDIQRYGDRLIAAKRFDEAAAQYRRVIDGGDGDWSAWLQYGGALDQAGRWRDARPALAKAVSLAPNEPLALNYLGYAQIEHHEDVAVSERLLERAAALKPDDASIADSLAWAYFRRGDTLRALPMLERAAAGEPDNAVIAEHLGDAYWRVGRHYEARYSWRAAETLADASDVARLAGKIADGLAR